MTERLKERFRSKAIKSFSILPENKSRELDRNNGRIIYNTSKQNGHFELRKEHRFSHMYWDTRILFAAIDQSLSFESKCDGETVEKFSDEKELSTFQLYKIASNLRRAVKDYGVETS